MNKCERWTSPHDAESGRAQGQLPSPREGWQPRPQQPAQRACLSWVGHRHAVEPYLSCYIPVAHMFLLGFERSSLTATKSWTHASKPCPADDTFWQCLSFLCCLGCDLCTQPCAALPCGPHPRGQQHRRNSHPNEGQWQWQDPGQVCAPKHRVMQRHSN